MLLQFFRKIEKEIMVQYFRDAVQELNIDIVFGKDAVYVAAAAMQLCSKPIYVATFRHFLEYGLNVLADFHVTESRHAGAAPPPAMWL